MFSARKIILCVLLLWPAALLAEEDSFRISDIRIDGLQRVSAGTVFAALPLNVGDSVNIAILQDASQTLFKSGYFDDIKLSRDGTVLVINVVERPAVASILIDGNKAIPSEKLLEVLKKAGLAEGLIFRRTILDGLAMELERTYVAQGRYGATVDAKVENLPQNRVALSLKIKEGKPASIKHINIVGNTVFSKEMLLEMFEQETSTWLSWMSDADKYSREKLEGDIERLRSHYMDRGYLRFKIDSTQVSLSPDKQSIYIVINITEGGVYQVSKVDLAGELKIPEEEIRRLLLLAPDRVFSQILMTKSSERIKQRLGNEGYTAAEVKELTDINDEKHTVDVTFFVNPQERKYVRRIDFRGNTKTVDEVLRREMRQMEGGVAAAYKIEQSKVRMQRLGFFKSVEMETLDVPGSGDQLDLQYTVEEQPSGSIGASLGFAQDSGVILGANIQQDNFLGTGKSVGFNISASDYQKEISFNYFDPYYTADGISRGFKFYYTQRDLDEVNISSYSVDTYGVDMNFGYPISEIEDVGFGVGYSHNDITIGNAPAQEISGTPVLYPTIVAYVDRPCVNLAAIGTPDATSGVPCGIIDGSNFNLPLTLLPPLTDPMFTTSPEGFLDIYGNVFDNLSFTASWRQSVLNRGRLATRGYSQSLSGEITIPGSDLEYWKLNYRAQYFKPLTRLFTLRLRTQLGYGAGYGTTDELPFYENFFVGGFGSVRGYERNSIGPHSTPGVAYVVSPTTAVSGTLSGTAYVFDPVTGKLERVILDDPEGTPFGGNVQVVGGAEIIFPLPFIKDQRSMQSSFFVDAGSAFDTDCGRTQLNCFSPDLAEMRYSYGLGLTWITGMGPLTFSLAKPIGDGDYDETEIFQFSLGQTF